jgi:hypothetical protein
MRNRVQKYICGISLVVMLSTTVPAMAAARGGGAPSNFFARVRNVIAHILDDLENKMTLPPG